MFYRQSVNNIEMVILCLDGGILDLNRLRYNYFNRICKQYDYSISKEDFTTALGNSKTMYDQSPIQEMISNNDINELIEKDLYEYAKLKQNIKKDGVDELLQFFKQKKIKIAVISTHKTKRAIQYLQLTRIYQYVDFVIGGDSQLPPLPNSAALDTIATQMGVAKENTVVIASFPSLVDAASEQFMNVVYIQDLVPATASINASVYKTVKNNLEMINVFLFSKYDTVEMYSSVLGMSKEMDLVTLEKTYQHLLLEYQDDIQLTALVKRTYRFFLMEVSNKKILNAPKKPLDSIFVYKENKVTAEPIKEEIETVTNENLHLIQEDVKNEEFTHVDTAPLVEEASISKKSEETSIDIAESFEKEATVINDLMDKINKTTVEKPINDNKNSVFEGTDGIKINVKLYTIIDGILDFVYVLIMAFVISIIGMAFYMVASDYLQNKWIVTDVINTIINCYMLVVRTINMCLFDGIHAIISVSPDYQMILKGNEFIFSLAIEVIMFTVFNIIIYYIIRLMSHIFNKGRETSD